MIGNIIKIIYYQIDKNGPINHYLMNYHNIPLWVLINFFTLGNLTKFYEILKDDIKNNISFEIAEKYNENYPIKNKKIII